jgi:2-amino-4-hydroxy-6-hydroxymethyldihydropteridine diphosphokinase
VGGPAQGWYLNAVVKGVTDLSPEDLLTACHEVEGSLGRVRLEPNGPRTLDVDLLLYGDEIRSSGALTLPHPRLHERLFVLVPLCEIDPCVRHPGLGMTAQALLEACRDRSRVRLRPPQGVRA